MDGSEGIEVILFDFGGVLAEEGFRNGLRQLAREQHLDPDALARAGMDAVYDSGFVLGQGTDADFWRLLRERTGLRGETRELNRRILEGFVVRPRMMEAVDRLREAGYRTAILSDQTHWLDDLIERHALARHFDRIYNSYHLGKGKRDPTLFDDVLRDLGIRPEQVLFIDDDPENIARARARGLRAWRYAGQAGFERRIRNLLKKQEPRHDPG